MAFSLLWRFLVAVALATASASSAQPPCDTSKSAAEVCDEFCNYRCGFYNRSQGEAGIPQRLTMYRLTPSNVTGIRNKDSADARGDIGYWLTKKNLTAECAREPATPGCILEGQNLYGLFVVEIDGQWGPYAQCNPVRLGGKDPEYHPVWRDDRDFMCGQDCLFPTATGCHGFGDKPQNVSNDPAFGAQCYCDGTKRHERTVGRSQPTFLREAWGGGGVPRAWGPQCQDGYKQLSPGHCLHGRAYRTLTAWSFESAVAMACDACREDVNCIGWTTEDNRTIKLFAGNASLVPGRCLGAHAVGGSWGKQKSWYGVGQLGGYWYSTPVEGECPKGVALGTDGCTWREVASVYKNASCVDGKVDTSVETFGAACFAGCGRPLNRTSDCYLNCYRDVLMGNAATNTSRIPHRQVVGPWTTAFEESDPKKGGCPEVAPLPCEGPQCDPLVHLSSGAEVVI